MKDEIRQIIIDVHRVQEKTNEYVEPQLRRMDNKISLLNKEFSDKLLDAQVNLDAKIEKVNQSVNSNSFQQQQQTNGLTKKIN